jgi:hypothetical protein
MFLYSRYSIRKRGVRTYLTSVEASRVSYSKVVSYKVEEVKERIKRGIRRKVIT